MSLDATEYKCTNCNTPFEKHIAEIGGYIPCEYCHLRREQARLDWMIGTGGCVGLDLSGNWRFEDRYGHEGAGKTSREAIDAAMRSAINPPIIDPDHAKISELDNTVDEAFDAYVKEFYAAGSDIDGHRGTVRAWNVLREAMQARRDTIKSRKGGGQ